MLSVIEIKSRLSSVMSLEDPFYEECLIDSRKAVQSAVKSCEKQILKQRQLEEKFEEMNAFESVLRAKGFQFIAGVDEAGRGPLVGPVVAGAAILPPDFKLFGLNDSKQLSETKRDEFYDYIVENAVAWGVGICDSELIDQINIYEATKVAMTRAIENLQIKPDYLLLDAMKLSLEIPQESFIKGDARSNSIAAASILAKVTRDRLMKDYAEKYPGYGFEKHMGYGTKEHLTAIEKLGPTPWHRMTFAPLKDRK
ncbi:MAG: ribonuclease [Bacillales bacterium]|jgi:ribonuclease HII|nr:ribonuclease [Bacillales bacterium]